MLITHNSNSGSGGSSNNVLPDPSGSGGNVPGDAQAGPHRKVLDGEASGLRDTDVGQIENKVDPFQDRRKKGLPSPTEKTVDAADRYVRLIC